MTLLSNAASWVSLTNVRVRHPSAANSRPRFRPTIEPLEVRALLAVMPGPEFQVNPVSGGEQSGAIVAADVQGDFIVAWEAVGQPGAPDGAYAQLFAASGTPLGRRLRSPLPRMTSP